MTTREKTSALGATFLFVLAFRPGYSEPASPANTPDHREHTASATYDGTPSSHPPFIEALNAGVDAYTPAEPNRIPLPYAATPAPQHYVETFRRVWRRQNRITFASGFYTRPNTRAIAFFWTDNPSRIFTCLQPERTRFMFAIKQAKISPCRRLSPK